MPDRSGAERQRKRTNRSVVALLAVAGVLLALAVIAAALTAQRIGRDTAEVEHTLQVRTAIYAVGTFNERVETARRGYLISGDRRFADGVMRSDALMRRSLSDLVRLTADNPAQSRRAAEIVKLRARKLPLIEAQLNNRAASLDQLQSIDLYNDQVVTTTRQMRSMLEAMDAEEVRLLSARNAAQQRSLRLFTLFGAACVAVLVLLVAAAVILIARTNRDLNMAQAKLRLANEGLEEAVAARTTDLTRANAEIQRFAYIVSHDLRSPLVNVLGFTAELDAAKKTLHDFLTKLFDRHPALRDEAAWLAVEQDLPEALGFIRVSTEKMDRLINSILDLSRQGRRVLTPERLDMTAVAQSVVATLHQRAEEAGATVTVSTLPAVTTDRMAVEQILANLVENALKYLSPERAGDVRIEGRQAGRWVEIDVIDNGRGIAPADHERIFDLFRRAGTQDQAGEGIGLANVRALAYRLGGRVGVQSQLGEGATFTLTLPESFTPAEAAS